MLSWSHVIATTVCFLNFSSFQMETLYQLNNNSFIPLSQPLVKVCYISIKLHIRASHKWNHIFVSAQPSGPVCISLSKMLLSSIHIAACVDFFSFYKCKIFHCMYIQQFDHPFISSWTFWVVSTFLAGVNMLWTLVYKYLSPCFHFSKYMLRSEISGLYNNFMFWFFEEPPNCFPQLLYCFTLPSIINKTPVSPHPHQHVLFSLKKLYINHANGCEMVLHCGFNLPFLMAS